jgi:hypothetical protein
MIDAVTETYVGKDLKGSGGHSESFQLEKKGSRIFVNVPDDGSVVNVIDRKTGELNKWGLNGVKANYSDRLAGTPKLHPRRASPLGRGLGGKGP